MHSVALWVETTFVFKWTAYCCKQSQVAVTQGVKHADWAEKACYSCWFKETQSDRRCQVLCFSISGPDKRQECSHSSVRVYWEQCSTEEKKFLQSAPPAGLKCLEKMTLPDGQQVCTENLVIGMFCLSATVTDEVYVGLSWAAEECRNISWTPKILVSVVTWWQKLTGMKAILINS